MGQFYKNDSTKDVLLKMGGTKMVLKDARSQNMQKTFTSTPCSPYPKGLGEAVQFVKFTSLKVLSVIYKL